MTNPTNRQIYLPNYKLNITVPTGYSDQEIDNAIQRNKAQIQQASPVFAQSQRYLQNALGPEVAGDGLQVPGLGITEVEARAMGTGPAIQAARDATQYNHADQIALLRHYAAQKAINSANQHPNPTRIVQQAQANLLPTDRLTAIGDRVTGAVSDVLNTPLMNHVLDFGSPGASQQLDGMQGYGAGLARSVLGFSSPASLETMALLGPVAAEPMGTNLLLGAFGAPIAASAYQRAQSGDVAGALGELTAFGLPFAFHGVRLAQEAKSAADYRAGARWMDENFGIEPEPSSQPLLPPGLDPNVYEAEIRQEQPSTPSLPSTDISLASGSSIDTPHIGIAMLRDGLRVDMDEDFGMEPEPSSQPLLPPGLDPNVYEAEIRQEQPSTPSLSSTDISLASGSSTDTPHIGIAMLRDGLRVDPADNVTRPTMESESPTPDSQETINLPSNVKANRSILSDADGLEPSAQEASVARSRFRATTSRDGVISLPTISDWLSDSSTFSSAASDLQSNVAFAKPAGIPITMTYGDALSFSDLLGAQNPLSKAINQLFADGTMKANLVLTLPQLTALRSLAEQNSIPSNGPGSYNRATLAKRLNIAAQSLSNSTETKVAASSTSEGTSDFGEKFIFHPMQGRVAFVQSESLESTGRKRIRVNSTQNGKDDIRIPLQQPGKIGDGYRIGQGQVVNVRSDPETGARLRNGRNPSAIGENETGTVRFVPGSPASNQPRRIKSIRVAVPFTELSESEKAKLPDPRFSIKGTLVDGHLSHEWWDGFLRHVTGLVPYDLVLLKDILQGETLRRAKHAFKKYPAVLQSLVMADDHMPNHIGATVIESPLSEGGYMIVLNGRVWFDPEDMLSVLSEEATHVAQNLAKRAFNFNLPYNQRPHEITAKQSAQYIAGRPEITHLNFPVRPLGEVPQGKAWDYMRPKEN
jgi:hypothetical protein